MDGNRPIMPPPEIPVGWKAVWNDLHDEWFYVNVLTSQTTWEKPTTPAFPSTISTVPSTDPPPQSPVPFQSNMAASAPTAHIPNPSGNNGAPLTKLQDDLAFEAEILADYDFEESESSLKSIDTSNAATAWSRKNSCRVLIKRYSKFNPAKIAAAQRELDALHALTNSDETIPSLLDYFDPANTIFLVCADRNDESLRKYIEGRGPLTDDPLKSVVTQLFGALANIFMKGFAHLRMTDESLFIDSNGQLTIKDFQYAVSYGKDKTDDLYAATGHDVSRPEGIWCPPELYAAEKDGSQYNGRKAVMWTCGVAIYFMATGLLEKLSTLDHPANPNRRRSTITSNRTEDGAMTPPPIATEALADSPKPRRFSLTAHRRRSSAVNTTYPIHSRKQSLSSQIPTRETLITYPGSRFDVPTYIRDIVSKMVVLDPKERAELIEVAVKVPKEFVLKGTRPLVELAWLDYKSHVGPYAGLGLGAEEWGGGAGDGSSIYSGISSLSQSFTGLLSGKNTKKIGDRDFSGRYSGW